MPCPSKPHTFDPPQPPHPYAHSSPSHLTPPHPTPPYPYTYPYPIPPTLLYPTAHSIPFRPIPPHSDIMCWNVQLSLSNTLSSPPNHCKPPNPTTVYDMQRVGFHIALRFIGRLSGTGYPKVRKGVLFAKRTPFREKDPIFTKRTLFIINIGNADIFVK